VQKRPVPNPKTGEAGMGDARAGEATTGEASANRFERNRSLYSRSRTHPIQKEDLMASTSLVTAICERIIEKLKKENPGVEYKRKPKEPKAPRKREKKPKVLD
jgi:hypothetical protein